MRNTLNRVMKLRRRSRRRHVKGPSPPREDTFCGFSSQQYIANMSQTGMAGRAASQQRRQLIGQASSTIGSQSSDVKTFDECRRSEKASYLRVGIRYSEYLEA